MYSYGYKVPQLQDRIARTRQPDPGDIWVDDAVEREVVAAPVEPPVSSTPEVPQRSLSPREFFESQILPQVREAIGSHGVHDAYIRSQRQANERDNLRRIEASDLEALNRLRGTPVSVPIQLPQPISYQGLGSAGFQPGIPGLFGQVEEINDELEELRKQRTVEAFSNLLTEYPELGRVFYAEPSQPGKAIRVRKEGFKPYLEYADREQVFSSPESRADLYNEIIADYSSLEGPSDITELTEALRAAEVDYTSGDPERQRVAREFLQNILPDPEKLKSIETPSFRENRPVIGGGGYVPMEGNPLIDRINRRAEAFNSLYGQLDFQDRKNVADVYSGLRQIPSRSGDKVGFYLDPDTKEVSITEFDDPDAYGVDVTRFVPGDIKLEKLDKDSFGNSEVSQNALRFLADYPITADTSISFSTKEPGFGDSGYSAKLLPPEIVNPVTSFVADTAFRGLRPGTLVSNSPLSSGDLLDKRLEEGKSASESNTLRRLQPFIDTNSPLPNLRGVAYSSAGFGPVDAFNTQLSYVDDKGQAIPIQLRRPEVPLRGRVAIRDVGEASVFTPSLPVSATPRYYSMDPLSAAASAVPEVIRNVKRVPASLLPGAADLIPSPEAIRTGYAEGPVAMGQQMAREFAQSLPTAAGAAMLLSTPVAAPLAPGIGAGMVGTAGARALNEVVRQETGEGIVPKVRQFLGTAPRTGVSSPGRVGEKPLVAEIKPLSAAQKKQMQSDLVRSEMQRRLDLAKERFNPAKGEFGLSEVLFGR